METTRRILTIRRSIIARSPVALANVTQTNDRFMTEPLEEVDGRTKLINLDSALFQQRYTVVIGDNKSICTNMIYHNHFAESTSLWTRYNLPLRTIPVLYKSSRTDTRRANSPNVITAYCLNSNKVI